MFFSKTLNQIKTEIGNESIKKLIADGWIVTAEYDNFDKGIDMDGYDLKREKQS